MTNSQLIESILAIDMKGEPSTICPQGNENSRSSGSRIIGLFGGQKLAKKYRRWLQFEVVVLCLLMIIVWGLLTLPIIFYFHPLPVVSIRFNVHQWHCCWWQPTHQKPNNHIPFHFQENREAVVNRNETIMVLNGT